MRLIGVSGSSGMIPNLTTPDVRAPTTPVLGAPTAISATSMTVPLTGAPIDVGGSGLATGLRQRALNSSFTVGLVTDASGALPLSRVSSGLASETTYFYRERYTDGVGNIGAFSATVSATTLAASDTVPDTFTFADQSSVALSTLIVSAPITVSGINAPAPISVTGGEYSIDGGAFTSTADTVTNGQQVRVRHTSSGANSASVNTTLTIGGVSDTFTTTTLAASGTITPAMTVEYVDTSGNLQTVSVSANGSTTITGVAPFFVEFDATATRSAIANTESAAWWDIGYRINYGENLGGAWPFFGASLDEDTEEPIFHRTFTAVGTRLVRLRVRDSGGNEATLSLTVNVQAPPTATLIPTSAGAWPVFTSGSHYALQAGGNYSSFGELRCDGLHNVLFSKSGAGADPIIGTFAPEGRGLSTTLLTPARNIRIQDIDCATFRASIIGYRYCGAVRGRVRTWNNDSPEFYYDNVANTANERENLRFPRGTFFWQTGEMNPPSGEQYIMITALRGFCAHGVDFHKNQATGNHGVRNFGLNLNYRHSRFRCSVASDSLIKHQPGSGIEAWNTFDQVGTVAGGKRRYAYPTSRPVVTNCVYHAAGSVIPTLCVSAGPENNDVGGQTGAIELAAFSNSISAQNAWQQVAGLDTQMNGRILSTRNIRLNNGTGSYVTQSSGTFSNNVPVPWRGPYRYETVNTRPVPSAFAGAIEASVIAEYIDTSGNRQTVSVIDGVTTINAVAPFFLKLDCTGTRAPAAYAAQSAITDERAHAMWAVGYRVNYGEAIGGNWTYPLGTAFSRDEDMGPPLFYRVFTTTGTKNVRVKMRDALGNERTVSFNVVLSAPATTINIAAGGAGWPTWQSGVRYTLNAGSNYTSYGRITFPNLHNIIIEKVGTGADPIISEFRPDPRDFGEVNNAPANDTMSRGLRLVNIDVGQFTEGLRSYQFVAFVGGTVRRWIAADLGFAYDNNANTTGRTNLRYPRGLAFVGTTIRNNGKTDGYVYIGVGRDISLQGCDVRYDGTQHQGTGNHLLLRIYGSHTSIRNTRFFMESYCSRPDLCGTVTSFLSISGTTDETWQAHDRLGPNAAGFQHSYGGEYMFMHRNQIYDTGSVQCNAISSTGGNPFESNAPNSRTWPELMGWEDNNFGNVSPLALSNANIEASGRWVASRNNRANNGAGAVVNATTSRAPNWASTPPDNVTYNGPYLIESTNSRPVPTAF